MRLYKSLLLSLLLFSGESLAADSAKNLEISIYNNNLALVKDSREINLEKGNNNVSFEGVASQIKPESVMILGKNINVLEQNYDYELITAQNIVTKSVGSEVKTVIQNPTTGENIFGRAKLLSASGTKPVLEFDYGIETDFSGRLIFEKLPQNLREKPTLLAKIYSPQAEVQELLLAYLTNGISWKSNYVALIKNLNVLDLTNWVTINNNSGVDYDNVKIQLVAGEVNQEYNTMPLRAMKMETFAMADAMAVNAMPAKGSTVEQISAYQLYTLPNRTDIKNNQNKQMNLFEKNNVKYQKEGRISSPLYFNNAYRAEFEKKHPQIYYIINNNEDSGLNIPLPMGTVRFYENDSNNNLQFIGERRIDNTAKGEKLELQLGDMFNVFVNGKIVDVKDVSDNSETLKENRNNPDLVQYMTKSCRNVDMVKDYIAEVEVVNGDNTEVKIVFLQNINQDSQIINENIKGNNKNINQYEWELIVPQNKKIKLEYTVRVNSKERVCN